MKNKLYSFLLLHILVFIYSISGIFSKFAGQEKFLSLNFFVFYGIMILMLFIYAIGWQKILKKIPLVTAFSNKSVTVVWGLIWGSVVFNEAIVMTKLIGALIVVYGVYWVVRDDE